MKIIYEVLSSILGIMIAVLICVFALYTMTTSEHYAFSSGFAFGLMSGFAVFICIQKSNESESTGHQSVDDGTDPDDIPSGGTDQSRGVKYV